MLIWSEYELFTTTIWFKRTSSRVLRWCQCVTLFLIIFWNWWTEFSKKKLVINKKKIIDNLIWVDGMKIVHLPNSICSLYKLPWMHLMWVKNLAIIYCLITMTWGCSRLMFYLFIDMLILSHWLLIVSLFLGLMLHHLLMVTNVQGG